MVSGTRCILATTYHWNDNHAHHANTSKCNGARFHLRKRIGCICIGTHCVYDVGISVIALARYDAYTQIIKLQRFFILGAPRQRRVAALAPPLFVLEMLGAAARQHHHRFPNILLPVFSKGAFQLF